MKSRTDKIILVGILLAGTVALFAKSAGAAPAASPGLSWDPGLGIPRVKLKSRYTEFTAFPVDVYGWGPDGMGAVLVVASDDPSSFVGYTPRPGGGVTAVLVRGPGAKTAQILAKLGVS